MKTLSWLIFSGLLTIVIMGGSALALELGQYAPMRFCSIGDSTTRAFDANLPLDNNQNVSWVNGYHGFGEDLLGQPDVKSHNQRLAANFGKKNRMNCTAAANGDDMSKLVFQASGIAGKNPHYVTVMLGSNDACRDSVADLPTPAQFSTRFRAGMDTLLANLSAGATVQVVAIPNVVRVYQMGVDKKALGLVDCPRVWARTGHCGSVLSSRVTAADRAFVLSRVIAYNGILKNVTAEKAAQNPGKFISFTDKSFTYPFTQKELSDLDCFHPSWEGQKILSRETWNDGPFKYHQKGK